MRRKVKNRKEVMPDIVYGSVKVARFTNYLMYSGKKNTAERAVHRAFDIIKEKTGNTNPLEVFDLAIKNASPSVEVQSRRVGGANYQVPREVRVDRRLALAMRWIVGATRSKKGTPVHLRLADELIAASKGEGEAVKKKENTHKMAEANKAFAHFSW
ncbi:MAG: 30S ribosomal protein S7 [Candidatus Yonathbacteria bacterium CG_4_10_14_3_um_filter_47_65]|uniref:Small ribosomal subunit protein uS7 n=2 Tax=Parcubacteria group TaxID=1794811 RepID=A0A2M8D9T8_9BACT|nr:MAG: 30S ribosomal protein S7 [Candidatus Nomurabacteria bacterium CG1_02_47_685]PIP04217.1 MAG: 30S ribosomal protein S7 [Candidatus Yonathbacteria bacterium CG23_combo_of_CG06-09_8_20_14_all_46_18]PIQ31609.1 MAG: 30S ribosomal protein S7 [Candidatus Yonathbacteria bacterium CG17_big_fil_post_rev_8_21_14_2_50_46_19]PIX56131.1 MAG: 30S ribosomal protein S7 [Candidatus Yonathbacteria bacterium CG_4_10_14_3_um_filter_47_65]PIY57689.1 MAG: 30S ribosomal protein S7 [Candidatus Yonathbacteria bac